MMRIQQSNFERRRDNVHGNVTVRTVCAPLYSPEIRPENCIVQEVLDTLWV